MPSPRRILALVLVLAGLGTPAKADLDAGYTAYKNGAYATALAELSPLADQGDPKAEHILGLMYSDGLGVQRDYAKAAGLLERSANQG